MAYTIKSVLKNLGKLLRVLKVPMRDTRLFPEEL